MDREKYYLYPITCPACGYVSIGNAIFCGRCRRYLQNPLILKYLRESTDFESVPPVRNNTKPERIYACEFEQMPFGYKYAVMSQIGLCNLYIDFCGCQTCKRLQNELAEYLFEFSRIYNSEQLDEVISRKDNININDGDFR